MPSARLMANTLVNLAITKGTTDNVTVLVLRLVALVKGTRDGAAPPSASAPVFSYPGLSNPTQYSNQTNLDPAPPLTAPTLLKPPSRANGGGDPGFIDGAWKTGKSKESAEKMVAGEALVIASPFAVDSSGYSAAAAASADDNSSDEPVGVAGNSARVVGGGAGDRRGSVPSQTLRLSNLHFSLAEFKPGLANPSRSISTPRVPSRGAALGLGQHPTGGPAKSLLPPAIAREGFSSADVFATAPLTVPEPLPTAIHAGTGGMGAGSVNSNSSKSPAVPTNGLTTGMNSRQLHVSGNQLTPRAPVTGGPVTARKVQYKRASEITPLAAPPESLPESSSIETNPSVKTTIS
jgi:hypothetical protein